MVELWSNADTVVSNSSDIFNAGVTLSTNDVVEFNGILILKGNDGSSPLVSAGITVQFTGTLWALPGEHYLHNLNITALDGTIISNDSGTVTKSEVNIEKVSLVAEDFDTTTNVLRFRVYNNLDYDLNYKYFIRFRYYNQL
jgi:hypothetical protein